MKTILCILALLVFSANAADAYVRRTVGGGHVVRGAGAYSGRYAGGAFGRGYYGHPVARGAAVAAGAAVAGAATGWGWNQPYYGATTAWGWGQPYGGGYYGGYGYDGGYANRSYVTGRPTLFPRYYGGGYGAYAATGYYGDGYGAYGASGYPGYSSGYYANRSYITGRPTLFPRYYGDQY